MLRFSVASHKFLPPRQALMGAQIHDRDKERSGRSARTSFPTILSYGPVVQLVRHDSLGRYCSLSMRVRLPPGPFWDDADTGNTQLRGKPVLIATDMRVRTPPVPLSIFILPFLYRIVKYDVYDATLSHLLHLIFRGQPPLLHSLGWRLCAYLGAFLLISSE